MCVLVLRSLAKLTDMCSGAKATSSSILNDARNYVLVDPHVLCEPSYQAFLQYICARERIGIHLPFLGLVRNGKLQRVLFAVAWKAPVLLAAVHILGHQLDFLFEWRQSVLT